MHSSRRPAYSLKNSWKKIKQKSVVNGGDDDDNFKKLGFNLFIYYLYEIVEYFGSYICFGV